MTGRATELVKSDILIYIDTACSDEELTFEGSFLPGELAERCASIENAERIFYSHPVGYSGCLSGGANSLVRSGHDSVDF